MPIFEQQSGTRKKVKVKDTNDIYTIFREVGCDHFKLEILNTEINCISCGQVWKIDTSKAIESLNYIKNTEERGDISV